MYFDAVLDHQYIPKFNGTSQEVKKWLRERRSMHDIYMGVCIGATMQIVPISEYLGE